MKIRIDEVELRKVRHVHVLEDHERVAVGRRQLDAGPGEYRVEVLGHPRVFLQRRAPLHRVKVLTRTSEHIHKVNIK